MGPLTDFSRTNKLRFFRETGAESFSLLISVHLGENCAGKMCPNNSDCEEDICGEKRCRCQLGYAQSAQGDSCFKRTFFFLPNTPIDDKDQDIKFLTS